ncbi:hypothetical protein EVB81_203 [Rhizobium phage RHph_I46]|uniref:Uncharacterized protein n=1 Tax=Rhizobium phage RHph_I1_9 TaxID=2509729 RepID=A0A7S5UXR0_9CAUD|nr:hypothetical protein PP936_gp201 [Rhizobium phage RHph_I1_9]QIG69772.1 hypothetical protein EVB81_203 [Rhizobium phage RHph_I46]QIG71053.1 hypothetical protein EVB92_203 [Rhizobium phage RHph_I9]QIG73638.1 hypothetical protein EVC04_201 [Rhizobium phage RHph_I1_9]QIG76392.1 hypothetical protein EVC25_203 [Rhizobium phage RHph_I34]
MSKKPQIIQPTSEENLEKLLAAKKYLIDFGIPNATADSLEENYSKLTEAFGDLMSRAHPCTPNRAQISQQERSECSDLAMELYERFLKLKVQFGNRECDRVR